MKKFAAMFLALILVLSLGACGTPESGETGESGSSVAEQPESGNPVVKIGIFEPASGDNGAGGKQETLGVEYANSVSPTVEIGGTTYDVQLVKVDNESSNEKA
ncbi:MAG TPA: amino acid ABC transporter substrate-binding protein, partial [Oscillospiraceae bacterium]|nr:amino acid ABC transporter substrate-binding protein [Oscillospiraceae bacterium]